MKMGMTLDDLQGTVGIHPTCAEDVVKLKITKSSGEDVEVVALTALREICDALRDLRELAKFAHIDPDTASHISDEEKEDAAELHDGSLERLNGVIEACKLEWSMLYR